MGAQDREYPPVWIAELKASLSLRETIERLAGVRFEEGGGRAKACCPFHRERTPSFFVDDAAGRYRCFGSGCGRSGDVIQFIAEWRSVGFREAVRLASEFARLPPPQPGHQPAAAVRVSDQEAWRQLARTPRLRPKLRRLTAPLLTIPKDVALPRPNETVSVHDRRGKRILRVTPSHVHVYRQADGNPLCLVLRSPAGGGGKFFLQATWHNRNPGGWNLLRFDRGWARPVYGMEDLPGWSMRGATRLLVVEGETTRDAAAGLLPAGSSGWLALTAMGGANAAGFADWKPLVDDLTRRQRSSARFTVVVWPDADEPVTDHRGQSIDRQLKFAASVRTALTAAAGPFRDLAGKLDFLRVLPPDPAPPGWDIADAVKEGWTADGLLSHMEKHAIAVAGGPQLRHAGAKTSLVEGSPVRDPAELSPAA